MEARGGGRRGEGGGSAMEKARAKKRVHRKYEGENVIFIVWNGMETRTTAVSSGVLRKRDTRVTMYAFKAEARGSVDAWCKTYSD